MPTQLSCESAGKELELLISKKSYMSPWLSVLMWQCPSLQMHAVAKTLHLDESATQLCAEILKLDIAHDQILALLKDCTTAEAAHYIRSSTDASTPISKVKLG